MIGIHDRIPPHVVDHDRVEDQSGHEADVAVAAGGDPDVANFRWAERDARIIEILSAIHALGRDHFEGKSNPTFGALTSEQWSRLFLKHQDYCLGHRNTNPRLVARTGDSMMQLFDLPSAIRDPISSLLDVLDPDVADPVLLRAVR